jgi:hypothetical protein
MKNKKPIYKFYRQCFFSGLKDLANKERPSMQYKLMAFLIARKTLVKSLSKFLIRHKELQLRNKYLCFALSKCTLPIYLSVKSYKFKTRKSLYCSKTRICGYCWVRSMCKSYCSLTRKISKGQTDQVFAYREQITVVDYSCTPEELRLASVHSFTKRHRFKASCLERIGVLGLTEMLCVYPSLNSEGNKVYILQLRQLAYCIKDSEFAKSALHVNKMPLEAPGISFCHFPAQIMKSTAGSILKVNEALRSVKLVRRYGLMFNTKKKNKPGA